MRLAPPDCLCFRCQDRSVYVCALCSRSTCRTHSRVTAAESYCCLCAPLGADPALTDVHPTPRNCRACAHSYMEPDDDLTCGHPDSGPMGLYVGNGHGPDSAGGHCGATRAKFSQHPLRNPDGNIKT